MCMRMRMRMRMRMSERERERVREGQTLQDASFCYGLFWDNSLRLIELNSNVRGRHSID